MSDNTFAIDRFEDFEVLDHAGNLRHLSELVGGDPAILNTIGVRGARRSNDSSVD